MVKFYNVRFNNEWVYADAYDVDYDTCGRIKVYRTKGMFKTNCTSENNFQKAAWSLRRDVNEGRVKQGDMTVVVWG